MKAYTTFKIVILNIHISSTRGSLKVFFFQKEIWWIFRSAIHSTRTVAREAERYMQTKTEFEEIHKQQPTAAATIHLISHITGIFRVERPSYYYYVRKCWPDSYSAIHRTLSAAREGKKNVCTKVIR